VIAAWGSCAFGSCYSIEEWAMIGMGILIFVAWLVIKDE
jgi:hypothetical protein